MVMFFGLCSAAVTFEQLIEGPYELCLIYLDDVIGHTFQEHLINLQKVLHFREAHLKLNP